MTIERAELISSACYGPSSLRTTMCLQYTAESIAAAAVSLAAYVRNVEVDQAEVWKHAEPEHAEGKCYPGFLFNLVCLVVRCFSLGPY